MNQSAEFAEVKYLVPQESADFAARRIASPSMMKLPCSETFPRNCLETLAVMVPDSVEFHEDG